MITKYRNNIYNQSKCYFPKKTLKKNSILHLDLEKLLSPKRNENQRNDSSSSKKLNIISYNETEPSTIRSLTNLKKTESKCIKIHKKINSLFDDIHSTKDSISPINSLRKNIQPNQKEVSNSPKSSRTERLYNKWKKIYSDLNNFENNLKNKKFKKKIKSIEKTNSNISSKINIKYDIQEPNFFHYGNNIKRDYNNVFQKNFSSNCNLINLTRKILEVKISNSFIHGKNSMKNSSRNKLKEIEREMNIKNKIRELKKFEFRNVIHKVNDDRKKEIHDNNIKMMNIFRNSITSKDNIIVEDIDINIAHNDINHKK
jgi:hypothetical protein